MEIRKCFRTECNESTTTKYCSNECVRKDNATKQINKGLDSQALYYENPKKCKNCGTVVEYPKRVNQYCGHSCAATCTNLSREKRPTNINNKKRIRPKRLNDSQKIKPSGNIGKCYAIGTVRIIHLKTCLNCHKKMVLQPKNKNRIYCNYNCFVQHGAQTCGLKSANIQSKDRRSKNEIYFSELCAEKFNITTNDAIFNGWDADVILNDFKVAVLWNGPWHRKKITKKHSVAQVQNRDRIKVNEIVKKGYIPYIIEDDGKYKKKFVDSMFDLFMDFMTISLNYK